MFDPQYDVYRVSQQAESSPHQSHIDLHVAALRLYQGARYRGRFSRWIDRLLRRDRGLIDLQGSLQDYRMWQFTEASIQTVALGRIAGSEGRTQDFDRFFRPLNGTDRQQWLAIAMHMLSGVILPPVELVEVEGVYFVRDGHLRVSVARALGLASISAQVARWQIEEPARWDVPVATQPLLQTVSS